MKTREKVLLCILAILLIAGIVCAGVFIQKQNKVKEYSVYCMDKVRAELGEYLENVHMNDAFGSEGVYVYMGGLRYEGVDYSYSCKVYNKENVELKLEVLYGDVSEEVNENEEVNDAEDISEPEEINEAEEVDEVVEVSETE